MSPPADAQQALDAVAADLTDEHAALAAVVEELGAEDLSRATPAQGWTVADSLSHLAGFDGTALRALVDPGGFTADVERIIAHGEDPVVAFTMQGRSMGELATLAWWLEGRRPLLEAIAGADPVIRVPWYGPAMSVRSFVTARLMETWAHGQDIRDALGVGPEVSSRLRHVAHIGVSARPFSYLVRGMELPADSVDVVLVGPGGEDWSWGPADSENRISGTALDFALLVTQRRHSDDLDLTITGPAAQEWMGIAQAFAGGASPGRAATGRAVDG